MLKPSPTAERIYAALQAGSPHAYLLQHHPPDRPCFHIGRGGTHVVSYTVDLSSEENHFFFSNRAEEANPVEFVLLFRQAKRGLVKLSLFGGQGQLLLEVNSENDSVSGHISIEYANEAGENIRRASILVYFSPRSPSTSGLILETDTKYREFLWAVSDLLTIRRGDYDV